MKAKKKPVAKKEVATKNVKAKKVVAPKVIIESADIFASGKAHISVIGKDVWAVGKDTKKEWRWCRIAPNGRVVGASTEGYKNKKDCVDNAKRHGYVESKKK